MLNKEVLEGKMYFRDLLAEMMDDDFDFSDDDEDDE